jgi:hypothetical protein
MTDDEIVRRLLSEEDFVFAPRYQNSLKALVEKYPDGVPDKIVAQALQIDVEEVPEAFARTVAKIKKQIRFR